MRQAKLNRCGIDICMKLIWKMETLQVIIIIGIAKISNSWQRETKMLIGFRSAGPESS